MSDLHLEFDSRALAGGTPLPSAGTSFDFYTHPPQPKADVLVLAGDIHDDAQGIDWGASHFAIPAVVIAGNHEPYGHELFHVIAHNRQKASNTNGQVTFLERGTWCWESPVGERARFIGTTLWTDFRLYGDPQAAMDTAQERLEDFKVIKIERGHKLRPLHPSDTSRLHATALAYLQRELGRPFDGITVVITHHAPSPRSIAPKFERDPLNPAFASNLDSLILAYQPTLWIHGHMHDSCDYTVGRTRVVCNPRGYFPGELNSAFDPLLVVEVTER